MANILNLALGAPGSNYNYSVQNTAPSSATDGDEWYDSSTGDFYKYLNDGTTQQWVEWGPNNSLDGSEDILGDILPGTTLTYSIGSPTFKLSGVHANTFYGLATSAQFADLAEKYLPDADYPKGTVMMIGGDAEVTASKAGARAIGAISIQPGFLMNSELEGGVYVALKGRIPLRCTGPISKGDELIPSDEGLAVAGEGKVFAVALESKDGDGEGVIEAVIL